MYIIVNFISGLFKGNMHTKLAECVVKRWQVMVILLHQMARGEWLNKIQTSVFFAIL